VIAVAATMTGCDGPTVDSRASAGESAASSPSRSAAATTAAAPVGPVTQGVGANPGLPPIAYETRGRGTFTIAPGASRVAGDAGSLLRYRVAVEQGIEHVDVPAFAAEVDATLADNRGWTGAGTLRLQRVGPDVHPDFTIYLVTPATRDDLCAGGYDRYTSCRNGDRVVLNVARWAGGVPQFDGDLATYRHYMVNHEVGHRLGHGHERCPAAGRPAPVMQQQTLGLHGCTPNGWPRVNGKSYSGPPGEYDDPTPRNG
jgi:hypothetical protein